MSKRELQIFVIAVIVFALAFFGIIFFAGRDFKWDKPDDIKATETIFIARSKGEKLWEIRARFVRITPDGQTAIYKDVTQGVIYRQEKPFLLIKAKNIKLNLHNFDFIASDGIDISTQDNRSFHTEKIYWSSDAKKLYCPDETIVKAEGKTLRAKTVSIDFRNGEITMSGIEVILKPETLVKEKIL